MNTKQLTVIIVFLSLFTACSPKYYVANTQNVPLLSTKGEGNLTLAGNSSQVEFQGAYAVTEKFAIKANGGLFIPKDQDNGNGGSGKFIEVGGGIYKPLNNNFVFETYAIGGIGSMENHFPSLADSTMKGDITANIVRFGLQPNLGYKSKNFLAAISARVIQLQYNKINGDLIFDSISQVQYLQDNNKMLLIEPAITLKAGFDKIKLQLQLVQSLNLTNDKFKQDKTFVSFGLCYNFVRN